LNPFHNVKYNIDREFPTGRRKEKSPDKTVVIARFSFSAEEIAKLAEIHESAEGLSEVEVKRDYGGQWFYTFLPSAPSNQYRDIPWVVDQIDNRLTEIPEGFSEHFQDKFRAALKSLREEVSGGGGSKRAIELCEQLRDQLGSFRHPPQAYNQAYQQDNTL